MPKTHEIAAYAQRLILEYNRARKLLRKYFKKRHNPDDAQAKIKEIIDNMTARQSKVIGYTLNDAFRKGVKEGNKEISNATISAAASSVSIGFDLTKVADTHLKNITQTNIGHIGKYNSVLTNQLQLEYNTLLADNKLVTSLSKNGWTPWLDKALEKRGVKPEVIALAKGQTTTRKVIDILEMEGIRGGKHPREVSKMLLPHIQRHFGPEGVVIDNVGKFKKVLKVDADGNFKYVKQAVTRPYRATHKAYSNLLARTSMIQAHHEGRYQSLQKTGLVDYYISVSVLDANTCNHCAMMHGQRVSKAEGPLYHPSCACDRKPVWKKDSGLKNKDPALFEKQRDQHFWKQHQLAEYNKHMPKGAKLKYHSMLPKDALTDMPGKETMSTIRYDALGKPTAIKPKVPISKAKTVKRMSDKEIADDLWRETAKDGKEHAIIRNGLPRTFSGNAHGVDFKPGDIPKTPFELHHTHPNWDSPPSIGDIGFFLGNSKNRVMVAASDKNIYKLTKMEKTRPVSSMLEKTHDALLNGLFLDKCRKHNISIARKSELTHKLYYESCVEVNKKLAYVYDYKFEVIKR
jgi:hypothetical protein